MFKKEDYKKMKVNKRGNKVFGYSIKPEIYNDFRFICEKEGLVGSRQIEIMMMNFIKKKVIV